MGRVSSFDLRRFLEGVLGIYLPIFQLSGKSNEKFSDPNELKNRFLELKF